jgi:hypothetical protein
LEHPNSLEGDCTSLERRAEYVAKAAGERRMVVVVSDTGKEKRRRKLVTGF